jgi:putative endonuclease
VARTHERGRRGEALAARYLEDHGWRVLARNWRAGHGEIDLVIQKGEVVAFVEVKTRKGGGAGDPLEGITRQKRLEVEKAARRWILTEGGGELYRFDAVAVTVSEHGGADIFHLPDAWWIGDG